MAQRLARRSYESTRDRPGFQGADQKRQSARLRETLQTEHIEICKHRFIFLSNCRDIFSYIRNKPQQQRSCS